MHQRRFDWAEQIHRTEPACVELPRETTEVVIALMARALAAVVRATEEAADER